MTDLDSPISNLSLTRKLRRPLFIALIVGGLFFGVFGAWATTAKISAGAMAPGTISPDGSRRTIQHLEGGIIADLFVREGDLVEAGQPLLVLEKTRAQVGDDVLGAREVSLKALIARLQAEQAGRSGITFPDALEQSQDPSIIEVRDIQRDVFRNRMNGRQSRTSALRAQITQLNAEIEGLTSLIESQSTQAALLLDEQETIQKLFDEGLAAEARLLELQRRYAEIIGARADNRANIARIQQSISQTELEILNYDAELQAEISEQLNDAQLELANVTTERSAAKDVLNRTTISAPIAGKVTSLQYKTIGGVITPGAPILDVVPTEEDLVIEARILPMDIDAIRVGTEASVQLSSFKARNLPRINGVVKTVSPDTFMDEITGAPYFKVSVEVDSAQLAQLEETLDLTLTLSPGMPAEVLLVTGERTLLQYLWDPLGSSVDQAFREK
ncbi:MAG: HlyD family type I secretion periplasmic adaptor subunit [Pseudomonadota bacterium]